MNMMVGEIRQIPAVNGGWMAAFINEPLPRAGTDANAVVSGMPTSTLAAIIVTGFRSNGHFCNVMTHISGGRWDQVEEAIGVILDPSAGKRRMTPLVENIVDLLTAERGVTGRMLKPYFETLLARLLPADVAERLCVHVACLSQELPR